MSEIESRVAAHYGRDVDLGSEILGALEAAGLATDVIDRSHLAGVEEFHLGGRHATVALLAGLDLGPTDHVLDVGCGIGGPARTIAAEAGCRVDGVDLTPEFIAAATVLSERTGLGELTSFAVGTAMSLDADDDTYDVATVLHVAMNIEDKPALMRELSRVVRPGGMVVVYDVMRVGDGEVPYPMPWAADSSASFLATPDEYASAMRVASLEPDTAVDHTDLVRRAVEGAMAAPPPVNLGTLMGADFPTMFGNLFAAMQRGTLAPTELVGRV